DLGRHTRATVARLEPADNAMRPIAGRYQRLADLLVARGSAAMPEDEAEWLALVALAQDEGVGPLLDHCLRLQPEIQFPAPARERLAALFDTAAYAYLLRR